jgi:UDP-glucuronate decarboxylase
VTTAGGGQDAAERVVAEDLDAITGALRDELAQVAGTHVLITGGAGFLGYYLLNTLDHFNKSASSAAEHISVTVFDNFARGVPSWLTRIDASPLIDVRRHDVTAALPEDQHPDWIVHAAGIASPIYYRLHPLETIDANIDGLRRILDHCRRRVETADPVRGVLFFSSSEIYGDPGPDAIPTPEDYRGNVSCTGPRACYDESKRFGETLCVTYARQYGVPVSMARPFNNYGPGLKLNDRRVIPDFARDVLAGRDIVMLSAGTSTRTFCYAADAITGYFKVLIRGRPGEPYNIGSESPEVSMSELAERIAAIARELNGYQGTVRHARSEDPDYLVDNPERRSPSIEKARRELGYDPQISLESGLERTLAWYTGPDAVGEDA